MYTYSVLTGVDASPLMTWGSIEGTPMRIESESSGPSFKIPKIPSREKIALKLADEVAKTSRERRKVSSGLTRYIVIQPASGCKLTTTSINCGG